MLGRKKRGNTVYDVPLSIPCPKCGNIVEKAPDQVAPQRGFTCSGCGHYFILTDEKVDELNRQRAARIGNLIDRYGRH